LSSWERLERVEQRAGSAYLEQQRRFQPQITVDFPQIPPRQTFELNSNQDFITSILTTVNSISDIAFQNLIIVENPVFALEFCSNYHSANIGQLLIERRISAHV
jgi:hypothetical protein